MSEVVDSKSNPGGSNQAESSFLDYDAKTESKPCAVKPFPLNKNNKDDECQRLKFNYKDNDLDMSVKAKKWIGALVSKEFDNKRYMGEVVKYRDKRQMFKVDYEKYVSEEVDYQELQKIVAPPTRVCQYLEATNPRWYREMEEKNKRHRLGDTKVPVHPRYYTSSSASQQQVKPRKRKSKRETGNKSAYIPLAFRETKKDAYIYY